MKRLTRTIKHSNWWNRPIEITFKKSLNDVINVDFSLCHGWWSNILVKIIKLQPVRLGPVLSQGSLPTVRQAEPAPAAVHQFSRGRLRDSTYTPPASWQRHFQKWASLENISLLSNDHFTQNLSQYSLKKVRLLSIFSQLNCNNWKVMRPSQHALASPVPDSSMRWERELDICFPIVVVTSSLSSVLL